MSVNPDFEISAKFLDEALAEMKALNIPTSPANIRVWYDFCEGENTDLVVAINELRDNKLVFDADLCYEIYHRFYGELPAERLEQFKTALNAMISELGIQLEGIADGSSECADALAEAEKALEAGCELTALKTITQQLIRESRKVLEHNHQMGDIVKSMQVQMSSLQVNLEKASLEALTDKLTGVSNRRAYDKKVDELMSNRKPEDNVCMLVMDIDHFKQFNDTHGHLMGDKVLRFVAQMILKVIKGDDFLARTGGEEFHLILEDCTLEGAIKVAEKIREVIGSAKLTKGKDRTPVGYVTLSIGVAKIGMNETRNDLINRADSYLYDAKAQGRNRVISEELFSA
ncbi:MAG: GGDEF domain-containing protein [Candidatus Pelagadaptatus aseana]|uniref:GGDEF domain-containing protein n=1 Tax=Candidatus Pelagadaptatus aseana TaxID=3120508 RepID=UPI0039B1613D